MRPISTGSPRCMTGNPPIAGFTPIMASPTGRHIRAPSTRCTHPSGDGKEGALRQPRFYTRHIIGIPRDESDAMLNYLYQHAENPLFQCRFRWTENAIAFWTTAAPAPRDVGLLAAHPRRHAGDGEGRTAGVRKVLPAR